MDKKTPINVKGLEVAPRGVIAAAPAHNEIGKKYMGETAPLRGDKRRTVREVNVNRIADHQESLEK